MRPAQQLLKDGSAVLTAPELMSEWSAFDARRGHLTHLSLHITEGVLMFEHQPRERAVRCSNCCGSTFNVHAVCDNCIRDGATIECHSVCDEVARTLAVTA